jgi:hypothetical protein
VKKIRNRLTYANVMSTLAVFMVLAGGTALAAGQLGKNSVGTKQLKKNSVTAAKIKTGAVTAAKLAAGAVGSANIAKGAITTEKIANGAVTGGQVDVSSLPTVPSAATANVASSLTALEPTHVVGEPGEPAFENGSANAVSPGAILPPVGFYKDHEGIVHLTGYAHAGGTTGTISVFTLPPGFRPAAGTVAVFELLNEAGAVIGGTGAFAEGVSASGKVIAGAKKTVALEGITYRAAS